MSASSARPGQAGALLQFLVLVSVTAGVGASVTLPNVPTWYAGLNKPSFSPPNWVFGPAWSILYIMMAFAAWLVWRRASNGRGFALGLWGVQLALNFLWSPLFFGLHAPAAALIDIAFLLAAIVATVLVFRRIDRLAALLMVPYLVWVGYAFALNLAITALN